MERIKYEIIKTMIGFLPLLAAIAGLFISVAFTELMRLL